MFDTTGKVSTQKVLEYINDSHHGELATRAAMPPSGLTNPKG
ncbi:REP element-mobilizing transposase RayT [Nostoc flagelliforme CCNUN1]|uniref:REP element-mobilizing transposase RayT n=1 Tax=Nostoc flagelliforme CCNUN1 TaxID=2038116 RepID=A0A2K8SUD6_9NOSO|nr:REP element-mobilizing transposase RayT [Nostoc flagelliforme CCNUN1]